MKGRYFCQGLVSRSAPGASSDRSGQRGPPAFSPASFRSPCMNPYAARAFRSIAEPENVLVQTAQRCADQEPQRCSYQTVDPRLVPPNAPTSAILSFSPRPPVAVDSSTLDSGSMCKCCQSRWSDSLLHSVRYGEHGQFVWLCFAIHPYVRSVFNVISLEFPSRDATGKHGKAPRSALS